MIHFPKHILVEIEKHLKEEKERVQKQRDNLTAQDPFQDTDRLVDNAASDAEANEENNHARYQAMTNELTQTLEAIDQALGRIANGTYGMCTSCGQMIDTDRLALIPMATLCVACETKKKK